MRIFIWTLIPLSFVLGQLQLVDKVYFPHVAMISLGIAALMANGMKTRLPTVLVLWLLIFLASTVISTALAPELEAVRASTQLILFSLAVVIPLLLVNEERLLHSLMLALLLGATINAVAGVLQSASWIANYGFVLIADGEWFRVKGFAVSPADYVMQLVVGLSLCEMLKNQRLHKWSRNLFVICLLFSNSRTALVILALYVVRALWRAGSRTIVRSAIAFAIALPFVLASAPGELVADRVFDIFNPGYNIKRMVTFDYVVQQILADPLHFLIGHGYGTFAFFHPIDLEDYNNTHNMYLHILFSGGVLGFVAFFGMLTYIIRDALKFARTTEKNARFASGAQGIVFLCLVVLVGGFVETNLVGVGSGTTVGLCLGCALAGNRIFRRDRYSHSSVKAHVACVS